MDIGADWLAVVGAVRWMYFSDWIRLAAFFESTVIGRVMTASNVFSKRYAEEEEEKEEEGGRYEAKDGRDDQGDEEWLGESGWMDGELRI